MVEKTIEGYEDAITTTPDKEGLGNLSI